MPNVNDLTVHSVTCLRVCPLKRNVDGPSMSQSYYMPTTVPLMVQLVTAHTTFSSDDHRSCQLTYSSVTNKYLRDSLRMSGSINSKFAYGTLGEKQGSIYARRQKSESKGTIHRCMHQILKLESLFTCGTECWDAIRSKMDGNPLCLL